MSNQDSEQRYCPICWEPLNKNGGCRAYCELETSETDKGLTEAEMLSQRIEVRKVQRRMAAAHLTKIENQIADDKERLKVIESELN